MFLGWKNKYCQNDYTPQSNLQIQCNLYQIPRFLGVHFLCSPDCVHFFTQLNKNLFNLYGNTKDTKQPKYSRESKTKPEVSGSLTSNYTTSLVIKTVLRWYKNRNTDQWDRIESPEIKPCTSGQPIYDKRGKNIKWRKDSLFNKGYQENQTNTYKSMKSEQHTQK